MPIAVVNFKLAGGGSVATGGGAVGVQIEGGVATRVYAQIITVAGTGCAISIVVGKYLGGSVVCFYPYFQS